MSIIDQFYVFMISDQFYVFMISDGRYLLGETNTIIRNKNGQKFIMLFLLSSYVSKFDGSRILCIKIWRFKNLTSINCSKYIWYMFFIQRYLILNSTNTQVFLHVFITYISDYTQSIHMRNCWFFVCELDLIPWPLD